MYCYAHTLAEVVFAELNYKDIDFEVHQSVQFFPIVYVCNGYFDSGGVVLFAKILLFLFSNANALMGM